MLAVAAGARFGLTAALIKGMTETLSRHFMIMKDLIPGMGGRAKAFAITEKP